MPSTTNRRSLKDKRIYCAHCKGEVKEEEEEAIQCDKCKKTLHALCSMLDKRQYDRLIENESEEYVCHICDESGSNIKSDLCDIKTKLNKLDGLQDAMNFMSKQFDDILKGISDNKKKLDSVEKENKVLKREIVELKKSLKVLNDNRVKNDCIVSGVETVVNMNATDTMLSVMKDVGVDLTLSDIDDAYFLKNKNNSNKQSMVVKFSTHKTKQKVIMAKHKLKENSNTKSVYVNEYLSKETLTLLNHARALKSIGYRQVYANGGRVYVKRSELSKPKVIRDSEEVDRILLEAATHRGRKSFVSTVSEEVHSEDNYAEPNSPLYHS